MSDICAKCQVRTQLVSGTQTILNSEEIYINIPVKIHEDSCGNACNVRRNKPRDSEGCGLHRARGKRSGFLRC